MKQKLCILEKKMEKKARTANISGNPLFERIIKDLEIDKNQLY